MVVYPILEDYCIKSAIFVGISTVASALEHLGGTGDTDDFTRKASLVLDVRFVTRLFTRGGFNEDFLAANGQTVTNREEDCVEVGFHGHSISPRHCRLHFFRQKLDDTT
jgi:hypothetical protein